MLKIFTLYTFKMIFEGLENDLSNYAKMVYMNCLIYHFEHLDLSEKNAHAFKIYKSEMDFDKSLKGFIELEKAGLIAIEEKHVNFHNAWGKHIDRNALIHSFQSPLNSAEAYKSQLLQSQTTKDFLGMKYKVSHEKYNVLVNEFIDHQTAVNKIYSDLHDVTKHFYYWVGKNHNNFNGTGKSTTILGM